MAGMAGIERGGVQTKGFGYRGHIYITSNVLGQSLRIRSARWRRWVCPRAAIDKRRSTIADLTGRPVTCQILFDNTFCVGGVQNETGSEGEPSREVGSTVLGWLGWLGNDAELAKRMKGGALPNSPHGASNRLIRPGWPLFVPGMDPSAASAIHFKENHFAGAQERRLAAP